MLVMHYTYSGVYSLMRSFISCSVGLALTLDTMYSSNSFES